PRSQAYNAAMNIEDQGKWLIMLFAAQVRACTYLLKLFINLILYSASEVPEISDRVVEIDRAMRWGYANKLGPFELWDAVGFEATTRRMEKERPIPENVHRMLSAGVKSFYRPADREGSPHTEYFDLAGGGGYKTLEDRPGILV